MPNSIWSELRPECESGLIRGCREPKARALYQSTNDIQEADE